MLGTALERWVVDIVAGIGCSVEAGKSRVVAGAALAVVVDRLVVVDRR